MNYLYINRIKVLTRSFFVLTLYMSFALATPKNLFLDREQAYISQQQKLPSITIKSTHVKFLKQENQWIQVELTGWVWHKSIGYKKKMPYQTKTKKTEVNLRRTPKGEKIILLSESTNVQVIKRKGKWKYISCTAWIKWSKEKLSQYGLLVPPSDRSSPVIDREVVKRKLDSNPVQSTTVLKKNVNESESSFDKNWIFILLSISIIVIIFIFYNKSRGDYDESTLVTPSNTSPNTYGKTKLTQRESTQINQLKQDARDWKIFVEEFLRVMIRLNDIQRQLFVANEVLNQVTDETPKNQLSGFVQEFLDSIDLPSTTHFIQTSSELFVVLATEFNDSWYKVIVDSTRHWPNHYKIDFSDLYEDMNRLANKFNIPYQENSPLIDQTHGYYQQLREYHPRYHKIMNRSGLLDFALGFAAGFFGGPLGASAMELWGGWRNTSDKEFLNIYVQALTDFMDKGFSITQNIENQAQSQIMEFVQLQFEFYDRVINRMEIAALNNVNIQEVYIEMRKPENKPDEDSKALFDIIMSNLKENGLSYKSEKNIRSLWG